MIAGDASCSTHQGIAHARRLLLQGIDTVNFLKFSMHLQFLFSISFYSFLKTVVSLQFILKSETKLCTVIEVGEEFLRNSFVVGVLTLYVTE